MNKIKAIGIGGAAVIILLVLVLLFSVYGHQISITSLDVEIDYTGLTSGYLGSPTQAYSFHMTVSPGQEFYITITFKSNAILLTHEITSITVNTPGFQLISISPSLPISIAPGGEISVTLEFQAPYTSYTGPLTITVYTE